jgi:hypothetical protein
LGAFIFLLTQVASATTYTVTNTLDSGAGSLRDALANVNGGSGGDTINFSGVTGTITVGSTLAITQRVTINGPGANLLAISGGDTVPIFNLGTPAANSAISGLTITHGNATVNGTSQGAGIHTVASLTVNNCTFSYNTAGAGVLNVGGAIFGGPQTVTVNGSTFFNNKTLVGNGGAINATNLVVNNSTFYNNTAALEGGAIWVQLGTRLAILNSTIVGNTSLSTTPGQLGGGGVWVNNPATLVNNVISGNTASAGPDYYCAVGSACGGTITPTPAGNLIGATTVTSLLTSLQYNGGPTMTMLPLQSGTGIIGAGLNSTLSTDQRGFARPTSGASDLGAVQTYNLVVTTTADSTNSGTNCTGDNTCSLRDALNLANSHGAGDVVTVTGLTGSITLTSPLPDDTANLNLTGPGANQLTISGAGSSGIFNITNPTAVTNITGVTLTNGSNTTSGGGAINNQGSILTLNNCELNNNSATGQQGGALNNGPSSTASVLDCTFSGNSASSGGAINNSGALNVENSTFNGNTASAGNGGAIFNSGLADVTSCTITGNTASALGGGVDNAGTIAVSNSIVAGNTETGSPNDDCGSCGTQTTFNLTSTAGTPVSVAQVMLAPLGYYGPNQTVRTMLPIPGSPVMQAGDLTQLPADVTTDERRQTRTINSKLDLGAVQSNYTSIQFVQQPSNTAVNTSISPAVTMSITESGTTVANIPLTLALTGAGNLHGILTESTVAPTVTGDPALASFEDLTGDTAGTGDTLTATLVLTPAGSASPQSLTASSDPFDITRAAGNTPVVSVGPSSPVYGQPETVTITVPATGSVAPTGTVTVYSNGNPIGTGTLDPNGSVIVTIPGGTLPVGTSSITVGYPGDTNYSSSTSAPVSVTVGALLSVPTVTVGPSSPTVGQPATVTVTVPTIGNTPATGTVTVYDNGNPIGTGTLGPDGTVTITIPGGLPAGNNNLTVGYSGGGMYGGTTSAAVPVIVAPAVVLDFTLTRTSAESQTIITGEAATIAVQVAPTNGTYPGNVIFAATGLPVGATATFTPATLAANGGPTSVNLKVHTAPLVSANRFDHVTSIALGLLLLPLLGTKRGQLIGNGRAARRYLFMVLVLLASAVTVTSLTGCGDRNGFFGHAPQTYTITITATSGSVQHSVNATLNVQ